MMFSLRYFGVDFWKLLPRVFHVFVTSSLLLSLFGCHSCCRCGATHGYHNGVTLDLLVPHGGWFTQPWQPEGLEAYTSAAFDQRLSVTLCMWSLVFGWFVLFYLCVPHVHTSTSRLVSFLLSCYTHTIICTHCSVTLSHDVSLFCSHTCR